MAPRSSSSSSGRMPRIAAAGLLLLLALAAVSEAAQVVGPAAPDSKETAGLGAWLLRGLPRRLLAPLYPGLGPACVSRLVQCSDTQSFSGRVKVSTKTTETNPGVKQVTEVTTRTGTETFTTERGRGNLIGALGSQSTTAISRGSGAQRAPQPLQPAATNGPRRCVPSSSAAEGLPRTPSGKGIPCSSDVDSLCSAFRVKAAIRVPAEKGQEPVQPSGLATGVLKPSLPPSDWLSPTSRRTGAASRELRSLASATSLPAPPAPPPSTSTSAYTSAFPVPARTDALLPAPCASTASRPRPCASTASMAAPAGPSASSRDSACFASSSGPAASARLSPLRPAAAAHASACSSPASPRRSPGSDAGMGAGAQSPSPVRQPPGVAAVAAASGAAPSGRGLAGPEAVQGQQRQTLGSIQVFSPVRASHRDKEQLGSVVVLTPVRRSARKSVGKSLTPMTTLLEATGWSYTPNKHLLGVSQSAGAESLAESAR
ncbi:hypothetical protein HYH03_002035 [Edaphochlamys debaryana]|uniref:Uncharacterized protein n=1 Tax=Edaphochlamys debaryana TaxID=47281 RepID=A0A835YFW6_9CHLO|nr:hypothetical protein HYH03_002035 [Edaphochlamys debaryana]|eukprot:KAG2500468.1 hypothetical protein HYH03_002035 [Edaphochlamys debaryana]